MMVFSFGVSILSPNGNAGAMFSLSHMAGSAAAMLGASAWAFAAVFSYVLNHLNLAKLGTLGGYISTLSLITLILFFSFPRRIKNLR